MSNNTYALCYTVKNDRDLLKYSCLYHLKKGCSRIYIFNDGSTDGTIDTIKDLPNITIINNVKPFINDNSPKWIKDLMHRWDDSFDVRKRINTYNAAKLAEIENIQWIGSIDSDEVISTKISTGKDILDFLKKVDNKYNQVLLRNLEVIPQNDKIKNPFLECSYFFKRFVITEQINRVTRAVFYKLTKNEEWQAWFDYYFYKLRFGGALNNLLIDPKNQSKIPSGYYLGYNNFKSLIRTADVDNFIFDIHKWTKGKNSPKNYVTGNILHYDLYSPQAFINKFKQRPKNMLIKRFYLRYKLALIALNSTESEVACFFDKNLVVEDPSKASICNLVIKINDVKDTLEEKKN